MRRERIELPIEWRKGNGWLVLIGGTSDAWRTTEEIDRAAVGLMSHEKPIAFVPAANCPPEYGTSFLSVYKRLGAPNGYVVPITNRKASYDEKNVGLLREAGLIYFGGGDTTALLESMTETRAVDAIADAYERGAVVVGMSAGAIALSAWGVSLGAGVLRGWAWLPRVLASVHHSSRRGALFDAAMREHPEMLGLGLPEDAALALGPRGEVEWWGKDEIVVKRGAAFDG